MQKEFTFNYQDRPYTVVITYKKGMRNITYRYKNDMFHVSCPYLTSRAIIEKGLNKYAGKLIQRNNDNKGMGEDYIYLLGIKVKLEEQGIIPFTDGTSIEYSSREDLNKKIRKYYLDLVTRRVRYYEKIMNVPSYKVKVRTMSTRLGSNSRKTKSLTFSMTLLHYSLDVIDSVVVHELAHILVFDHSAKFYEVVYKYCPNYQQCRKKLRKAEFH